MGSPRSLTSRSRVSQAGFLSGCPLPEDIPGVCVCISALVRRQLGKQFKYFEPFTFKSKEIFCFDA